MKSLQVSRIIFFLLIIGIIASFNKEENTDSIKITVKQEKNITESGFTANWSVNSQQITSVSIELSTEESFDTNKLIVDIIDPYQTSQKIEGLSGATTYFYKIIMEMEDGNILMSDIVSVTTSYTTVTIKITTSDGINLAGKLKYLESNSSKKPGIVFMHELRALGNEWNDAKVVTQLIAKGYVCLILDFRGHFLSDYVELPTENSQVEAFIYEVSKDLIAAVEFMKTHEKVDGNNIALVGGSLGAIMAIAGNGYDEVKASVALSGTKLGMYSIFPSLQVKSTFFIAAENDITSQGINFAAEATEMYHVSDEPKKLKIIPNSDEHGTILLNVPGLNQEIIDWIDARFNEK